MRQFNVADVLQTYLSAVNTQCDYQIRSSILLIKTLAIAYSATQTSAAGLRGVSRQCTQSLCQERSRSHRGGDQDIYITLSTYQIRALDLIEHI